MNAIEILNCFRNQYYAEGNATWYGQVANAINDVLPKLVEQECTYKYKSVQDTLVEVIDLFIYYIETRPIEGVYDSDIITKLRTVQSSYLEGE